LINRDSHGDIVADTLNQYRDRIKEEDGTPEPYLRIQKKLQKIANEGKKVLVDIRDSYSTQTVVLKFGYIGTRWAMGKSVCYTSEGEVKVPYTIHYSDIVSQKSNIKFIVEGENPVERYK